MNAATAFWVPFKNLEVGMSLLHLFDGLIKRRVPGIRAACTVSAQAHIGLEIINQGVIFRDVIAVVSIFFESGIIITQRPYKPRELHTLLDHPLTIALT